MVSPAIEGHTESGLPFGSTSGHIYKNMPALVRRAYSIPYDVFEIGDYQAKYYTIMRIALELDVRFLATANPSSVLQLLDKANAHGEELIRDIRDGALSDAQTSRRRFDSTFSNGCVATQARRAARCDALPDATGGWYPVTTGRSSP